MIRWKLAKRPSGAAEWLSARSVRDSKFEQNPEQPGSPPTLRAARRRDHRQSPVSSGQFRAFLVEMPGTAPTYKRDLSNLREVTMTMSEYEERFRLQAPSLHQTFAEVRRPNRGGRRSRRLWVTAALVGVMTITSKAALHHSSHANGSQVSKSGVQACDFIYR